MPPKQILSKLIAIIQEIFERDLLFSIARISSTNVVERIIREIRCRSRVIGVFPNKESYVRLITCYLIEYSEDWINERSYIKRENIIIALETRNSLLAEGTAC